MTNHGAGQRRLIELLAGIDFGPRYYELCEARQGLEDLRDEAPSHQQLRRVLAATGLDFRYDEVEDFFGHQQEHGDIVLGLNVAFAIGTVEHILVVRSRHGVVGGPFTLLARDVARLREPDFSPSPRAPKLPFATEQELGEAVRHGVQLFLDARDAILASGVFSAR